MPTIDLFRNKYRIPSTRLSGWNYANAAPYFITTCAYKHQRHFGHIADGEMHLTEIGHYAFDHWLAIPEKRPDMNLTLGDFVIMPNHMHGILFIGENDFNQNPDDRLRKNVFGPQKKNIPSIMGGYKSAVTSYARKSGIEFSWQPRYHDHVIRDQQEWERISNYILHNIDNWPADCFFNPL